MDTESAETSTHNSVLIADDDMFIRNQLRAILAEKSREVQTVNNAEEAIKMLKKKKFDVLVMDVYMENMTGVEAIPVVKKIYPEAVIIIITGDDSLELERTVREQGVFAYFLKPIEQTLFERTIEAAFNYPKKKKL